jgi:hypothetical protein
LAFSRGKHEIDDMKILKQNIVGFIEGAKSSKNRYEKEFIILHIK